MSTSSRLLALLSLLQTPREWAGGELAGRLGVSTRTVRRDVERLRDLGYPVRAAMGPAGGYRLVAGTAMPPLLLDDEEAVAVAVGLSAAASQPVEGIGEASARALAKLEQVLPSRLRPRLAALTAATVAAAPWSAGRGPGVSPSDLAALAVAVAGRERLRFSYRAADDAETRRLVEPERLVVAGRRWYLLAFDIDRDDWRTFRVDRISGPRGIGQRSAGRAVPGGDPAEFLAERMAALVRHVETDVTLRMPVAEAARWSGGSGELEEIGPDEVRVRGHADAVEFVAMRLIMSGRPFTVHGPPELVTYVRNLAERSAEAVATPGN
ncbi:helix-turn-helix transcriptional regulator [Actinomadura flavalba]|uniref:helix-turn-helix transcriptional regulator n=1 Tax=Actinomadura flavalba TaxID=1120938 RepID=UPI000477FB6A|nr:WYL domain-containing protein [Actinomadura flavalba]